MNELKEWCVEKKEEEEGEESHLIQVTKERRRKVNENAGRERKVK